MKKQLQSEEAKKIALSSLAYEHPINLEDIDLTKDVYDDKQVAEIFRISSRTLVNHRKKGLISYFKMGSKTLYLKKILMLDILKIYND